MCTTIKVNYENGAVMGRNMDWDTDVMYQILYFPRDTIYSFDLNGNQLKNKYRMLGMCFRNMNPLKDGVNEHGLMGCSNMFLMMNLHSNQPEDGKINISSLDFVNYALANFKTVRELKEALPNLHIAKRDYNGNKVISPDFHYYFADPTGDSIIVEPENKMLKAKEDPYNVMTNSPALSHHIRALNKTFVQEGRKFNPSKDLPGGFDPVSRFIKVYYLKKNITPAVTMTDALENTYSILEALKIPEAFTKTEFDYTYTKYVSAYDGNSKLLTVRSNMNPKIYAVSIDDLSHLTIRTTIPVPQTIELAKLM